MTAGPYLELHPSSPEEVFEGHFLELVPPLEPVPDVILALQASATVELRYGGHPVITGPAVRYTNGIPTVGTSTPEQRIANILAIYR